MPTWLADFDASQLPDVIAAGLFGGAAVAFVVAAARAMRL